MTKPTPVGCTCGAVHYEFAVEPATTNDCQCRQCQKESPIGHGSLTSPSSGTEPKVTGNIRCFEVTGDAGIVKSRTFCPVCGTQLYIDFPAMPGIFAVRAGTLQTNPTDTSRNSSSGRLLGRDGIRSILRCSASTGCRPRQATSEIAHRREAIALLGRDHLLSKMSKAIRLIRSG